jgi:hypothetical protein
MNTYICSFERESLLGLPHIQQLIYLLGIRPYMDSKTSTVGIKRRISYQSLSEALYIEPHPGIQSGSPSKAQLRRALKGLERAGLVSIQSIEKQLILKCLLAGRDNSVQNKAVTKPSYEAVTNPSLNNTINKEVLESSSNKAGTTETPKAVIPLSKNNYLYLSLKFEKFWEMYPVKKSKQKAFLEFETLNPDEDLFESIVRSLSAQIACSQKQKTLGEWVAPWKYPANWLAQRAWEDEINEEELKEKQHASGQKHSKRAAIKDAFYDACKEGDESEQNQSNVVKLNCFQSP